MKAIVYSQYGNPEVLKLKDIDKPVPKSNEVLIKIYATSLNASDGEFLKGRPFYTRMWGLFKPGKTILGSDIAGVVEACGEEVKEFKKGDAVFGDIFDFWGGLAEYVCVPANRLLLKPGSISFEKASSIPQAALVALQGLRDNGKVQPGQKVLINGAGGGSGSFAVQLAKLFGAHVTCVDSLQKFELMRLLGADEVIDYTQEDFTENRQKYDLILDLIASHSIFHYKRALTKKGVYIMVGGNIPHLLQTAVFGSIISLTGKRKMGILGAKPNKGLADIIQFIESGKIKPVVDRTFKLDETPEAFKVLIEENVKGKIVIRINQEEK
ncbi:MAG: NAD(P)-dependent alcohol dehydrogenase [Calditrichaeota bacterium]|nr:MAG: NAD(P)-dependent alcohol dehydrogenase [Calditrichota bacterium]MBL1205940.1 NAD(P)-dependent alcohol dehydrogenase [Calditrichota bacterium]NOG45768.1 NAD(P)-dependent alcohol dehydrogenase [Calditrichota bacterium]